MTPQPHAYPPQPLGMKIFFCAVVAIFGLVGIGLIRAAIAELLRVSRRRKHLIRLPGIVQTVVKEQRYRAGSSGGSRRKSFYWMEYFPIIAFTTPQGERVEFRSELGETHQIRTKLGGSPMPPPPPRWRDGEKIEIFYDPAGEMKPCIAVAWSLWFTGLGMLAAGFCFLGASVGMVLLFTKKVFA